MTFSSDAKTLTAKKAVLIDDKSSAGCQASNTFNEGDNVYAGGISTTDTHMCFSKVSPVCANLLPKSTSEMCDWGKSDDGLGVGAIVGIAIGSVVFCACIGVGVFLMMKKTKEAAVTPS